MRKKIKNKTDKNIIQFNWNWTYNNIFFQCMVQLKFMMYLYSHRTVNITKVVSTSSYSGKMSYTWRWRNCFETYNVRHFTTNLELYDDVLVFFNGITIQLQTVLTVALYCERKATRKTLQQTGLGSSMRGNPRRVFVLSLTY